MEMPPQWFDIGVFRDLHTRYAEIAPCDAATA
jgi:hypothetical protein